MQRVISTVVRAEAWLFDQWCGVETSDTVPQLYGPEGEQYWHIATRPAVARRLLRSLPISRPEDYSFVDAGSGKGRMLLLASELPFRKVIGIEIADDLHRASLANLAAARNLKRRCSEVESIKMDAALFDPPPDNLVVYLFNPFGPKTMAQFLHRLSTSQALNPREILLVTGFIDRSRITDAIPSVATLSDAGPFHLFRLPQDRVSNTAAGVG